MGLIKLFLRQYRFISTNNHIWKATTLYRIPKEKTITTEKSFNINDNKSSETILNLGKISQKHPDYHIVYMFKFPNFALLYNKVKIAFTVGSILNMPLAYYFHYMSWISYNEALSSIASGIYFSFLLHMNGILFNNTVNCVYYNKDMDNIKISYTSYCGKKIECDTKIQEIYSPMDTPSLFMDKYFTDVYQRIKIHHHKKLLKLYNEKVASIYNKQVINKLFQNIK